MNVYISHLCSHIYSKNLRFSYVSWFKVSNFGYLPGTVCQRDLWSFFISLFSSGMYTDLISQLFDTFPSIPNTIFQGSQNLYYRLRDVCEQSEQPLPFDLWLLISSLTSGTCTDPISNLRNIQSNSSISDLTFHCISRFAYLPGTGCLRDLWSLNSLCSPQECVQIPVALVHHHVDGERRAVVAHRAEGLVQTEEMDTVLLIFRLWMLW